MTDTADFTLRGYCGYLMKRAFQTIRGDVTAALAPLDLRMVTFSALVVIRDVPGLRQSQLAEVLMIERPNLVVILDELERRDLITRDRVPEDRRAYALSVTEAGQALCAQALNAVDAHEARMMAVLTMAEREALLNALQKIEVAR